MNRELYRPLGDHEKQVLFHLLKPLFCGRDALSEQVQRSTVCELDENGSLAFQLSEPVELATVKYVVPTEGVYEDLDGVPVHILLHVNCGRLKELEIFKEDNSQLRGMLEVSDIHVFAPE